MLPRTGFKPLAAFMIDQEQGFSEDQTVFRRLPVDAASRYGHGFPGERGVIHLEIIAKERKPKAALTLKRSMASPSVAAQASQERHDMLLKIGYFLPMGSFKSFAHRRKNLRASISR